MEEVEKYARIDGKHKERDGKSKNQKEMAKRQRHCRSSSSWHSGNESD